MPVGLCLGHAGRPPSWLWQEVCSWPAFSQQQNPFELQSPAEPSISVWYPQSTEAFVTWSLLLGRPMGNMLLFSSVWDNSIIHSVHSLHSPLAQKCSVGAPGWHPVKLNLMEAHQLTQSTMLFWIATMWSPGQENLHLMAVFSLTCWLIYA
jgi:hypothetical protein